MKAITNFAIIGILIGILTVPAVAGDMKHDTHGGGKMDPSTDMKSHAGDKMDHSAHLGKMIREAKVDGFELAYHLIDMKERMKDMKGMTGMKGMEMTHHLMLHIKDSQSQNVEKAAVGYLVINPDGSKNKAMAMYMNGGFGADVNLKTKETYTIKAKAVVDGKKLVDSFTYEVPGG